MAKCDVSTCGPQALCWPEVHKNPHAPKPVPPPVSPTRPALIYCIVPHLVVRRRDEAPQQLRPQQVGLCRQGASVALHGGAVLPHQLHLVLTHRLQLLANGKGWGTEFHCTSREGKGKAGCSNAAYRAAEDYLLACRLQLLAASGATWVALLLLDYRLTVSTLNTSRPALTQVANPTPLAKRPVSQRRAPACSRRRTNFANLGLYPAGIPRLDCLPPPAAGLPWPTRTCSRCISRRCSCTVLDRASSRHASHTAASDPRVLAMPRSVASRRLRAARPASPRHARSATMPRARSQARSRGARRRQVRAVANRSLLQHQRKAVKPPAACGFNVPYPVARVPPTCRPHAKMFRPAVAPPAAPPQGPNAVAAAPPAAAATPIAVSPACGQGPLRVLRGPPRRAARSAARRGGAAGTGVATGAPGTPTSAAQAHDGGETTAKRHP